MEEQKFRVTRFYRECVTQNNACPHILHVVAVRGFVHSTYCLTMRFEWVALLHCIRMMAWRPALLIVYHGFSQSL